MTSGGRRPSYNCKCGNISEQCKMELLLWTTNRKSCMARGIAGIPMTSVTFKVIHLLLSFPNVFHKAV